MTGGLATLVPRLILSDSTSARAVSLNEAWNAVCRNICQDTLEVMNPRRV